MPMYTGSSEQSLLLKREIAAFLGVDVTYLGDHLVTMSEGRLSLSVIDEYIAEPGQRLMIPHLEYIPSFGQWTTDQIYDELEQPGKPFFLIRAFKQKIFPEREAITKRPPNPAFLVGAFWSLFFQNPPHNQPSGFFPQLPITVQDAIRRFWSDYLKVLHREVNPGAKYNPSDPLRKMKVQRRARRKNGKNRSSYSKSVKGKERSLILSPKVPSRKKSISSEISSEMAQEQDELSNSSLISSLASLQFANLSEFDSPGSSQLQLSPAMSYTSQYTTNSSNSGPQDLSAFEFGGGRMLGYNNPGESLLFSEAEYHHHNESAGASSSEYMHPYSTSQTANNHQELSTSRYYEIPPIELPNDMHTLNMWLSHQWVASGHSSTY